MTQNSKQGLLKQGKSYFFSPDFLSTANTVVLPHEALRNLPFLACGFHLIIQDGSSIPEDRMEKETKRQKAYSSSLLRTFPDFRRERNTPKRDEVQTSLL